MGNKLIKEYQPIGEWTRIRFLKKYSYQGNIHEIGDMIEIMDKTSEWLKNNELIEEYKLTDLDDMFLDKIEIIVGEDNDWLQDSGLYMEIQKDFRKIYNIKSFVFRSGWC